MKPFETKSDAFAWIEQNVEIGTLVSVRFADGFTTLNRPDRNREPKAFPVYVGFGVIL